MMFRKIDPKNLVARYENTWWDIVEMTQEKITIKNAHKELTLDIGEVQVNIMSDGLGEAHTPTAEEPWS